VRPAPGARRIAVTNTVPQGSGSAPRSLVLEVEPLAPDAAAAAFAGQLAISTDPSDVHADLAARAEGVVVIDARSPDAYARGHVPGALSLPHRRIGDAASVAHLPRGGVIVTYCDGIGCNASTKAASKLSRLGYRVKEMLGGLDWWIRDGYAVETGAPGAKP
jgi:rhodanese-related sulfurtransferase